MLQASLLKQLAIYNAVHLGSGSSAIYPPCCKTVMELVNKLTAMMIRLKPMRLLPCMGVGALILLPVLLLLLV